MATAVLISWVSIIIYSSIRYNDYFGLLYSGIDRESVTIWKQLLYPLVGVIA